MSRPDLFDLLERLENLRGAANKDHASPQISELRTRILESTLSEDQKLQLRIQLAWLALSKDNPSAQLPELLALRSQNRRQSQHLLLRAAQIWANEVLNIYSENSNDPRLEQYYHCLHQVHFSPWWLTLHVAHLHLRAGRRAEALRLGRSLLALSPRDPDYLRGCISLAHDAQDRNWLDEIRARLVEWRGRHPRWTAYHRLLVLMETLNPTDDAAAAALRPEAADESK